MNKRNILVVSDPVKGSTNLNNWMANSNEFMLNIVATDEKAIELMHVYTFDMVVTDNTDESIDNKKLKAITPILQSDVLIVSHMGEAADELHEKVKAAFEFRKIQRMKKLMVLDSSGPNQWTSIEPFSLN
ncbi:MAG: hypothetical protein ACJ748_12085 [Flavisolibacter sp.]